LLQSFCAGVKWAKTIFKKLGALVAAQKVFPRQSLTQRAQLVCKNIHHTMGKKAK
jgi:hypothetical protein